MPASSNQTLVIERDMSAEALQSNNVTSDAGAVASVSRVYKGEPSGTVFSPALKISFDAPKDLVSSTQPMALLYATTGIDNKEIMKIDLRRTLFISMVLVRKCLLLTSLSLPQVLSWH